MLEKYKKGELAEEQMEQVEADLIHKMFRKQKEDALRNDLKKLAALADNEEIAVAEPVQNTRMTVVHRSNNQRIWWAAAASVAVLAVASWWFFLKPKPTELFDNQTLADTYLKRDAAPVWSTMMDTTTVAERELKAKEAYQNADFEKAIPLFEAIPPSKKEHYFYLGVAALKQQKMDAQKAIDNLLKARALANGWQEDAINWYLALAYLQVGKTEEARKELNNIVKIGRDNVSRAEEILKKMSNK
jgi:tetratricopeptide (TPR) repeat protein